MPQKKQKASRKTKKPEEMTLDELLASAIAKAKKTPFKPIAYYNETGDIVEAIWEDCSYYAEYLNPEITIMRRMHIDGKKGDIIGVQIWALNDDKGKSRRIKDVIKSNKTVDKS